MRSGGRSSRRIDRHSAFVSFVERHLEPRRELDGAQHAKTVVAERGGIDRPENLSLSRSARPLKGSKYCSVSGSHEIALTVKSRRRAASSIDIDGSPSTMKPLCPGALFDSRRGSPMSIVADLVDGETLPDRLDFAEWLRAAPANRRRESRRPPCRDLSSSADASSRRRSAGSSSRSRTQPPTTSARPPRVAHRARDFGHHKSASRRPFRDNTVSR